MNTIKKIKGGCCRYRKGDQVSKERLEEGDTIIVERILETDAAYLIFQEGDSKKYFLPASKVIFKGVINDYKILVPNGWSHSEIILGLIAGISGLDMELIHINRDILSYKCV